MTQQTQQYAPSLHFAHFRNRDSRGNVSSFGGATVAYFPPVDGVILGAAAICSDSDQFNKSLGMRLARERFEAREAPYFVELNLTESLAYDIKNGIPQRLDGVFLPFNPANLAVAAATQRILTSVSAEFQELIKTDNAFRADMIYNLLGHIATKVQKAVRQGVK